MTEKVYNNENRQNINDILFVSGFVVLHPIHAVSGCEGNKARINGVWTYAGLGAERRKSEAPDGRSALARRFDRARIGLCRISPGGNEERDDKIMEKTHRTTMGALKRLLVLLLAAIVAFGFGPWPLVFAEEPPAVIPKTDAGTNDFGTGAKAKESFQARQAFAAYYKDSSDSLTDRMAGLVIDISEIAIPLIVTGTSTFQKLAYSAQKSSMQSINGDLLKINNSLYDLTSPDISGQINNRMGTAQEKIDELPDSETKTALNAELGGIKTDLNDNDYVNAYATQKGNLETVMNGIDLENILSSGFLSNLAKLPTAIDEFITASGDINGIKNRLDALEKKLPTFLRLDDGASGISVAIGGSNSLTYSISVINPKDDGIYAFSWDTPTSDSDELIAAIAPVPGANNRATLTVTAKDDAIAGVAAATVAITAHATATED
ncbi:MAG: hypothetical protein LBE16_00790, partial [Clostridiales Family XIII bacterium]|nr:hypothetical protein [Clostridiales Family XIII bacterium]